MAEQRTNDQSPKGGTEYSPEVLQKMSVEELDKVKKEIEKRLNQRGSSRPVTHANNWLDNKKSERDYLNMVNDVISDKMDEGVKTFEDFIKEDLNSDDLSEVQQILLEILNSTLELKDIPFTDGESGKFDQEIDEKSILSAVKKIYDLIGDLESGKSI